MKIITLQSAPGDPAGHDPTMTIRTFTRHCRSELQKVFEPDVVILDPVAFDEPTPEPASWGDYFEPGNDGETLVAVAAPEPVLALEPAVEEETGSLALATLAPSALDFVRPDYLGLRTHPFVVAAGLEVMRRLNVAAPRLAAREESARACAELEAELSSMLGLEHVLLAESGEAACHAAITGAVRPHDHVLVDQRARACLHDGARAATHNVTVLPRLDAEAASAVLRELRAREPHAGILVVTAGLFERDAELGALAELRSVTRAYGATLLVDVTHDLGLLGPRGLGQLGAERLLDDADLVAGGFAECLAGRGGFVAAAGADVANAIRYHAGQHFRSGAIGAVDAAQIVEAIRIARSVEGDSLRERLEEASLTMRDALDRHGVLCTGDLTPIVTVPLASDIAARRVAQKLEAAGVIADVAGDVRGGSAVRFYVGAAHTPDDVIAASEHIAEAIRATELELSERSVLRQNRARSTTAA